MAGPLTWRDVSIPNFGGVADSQRTAALLLDRGLGGLAESLGRFQQAQFDAQTRPFELEKLRLANAQTGVQTQGMQTNNDIKSFGLVTAQRDDTQAQARLAAQPEAAKLLADVRMLASSGDPAKVEQARGMIANGTQTLINAGYKAEAVSGLLDAERAAGLAGFGYKKEVLDNQKFWENQGISQQARDLAFGQINANATPDVAIRSIQENTEIKDPRIKAQAIQVIQQAADENVFATADPAEQLIRSLGVQYNVPGTGAGNPLVALVDRTEGAGRYDTLFGHAQQAGGPFTGVDVSQQTIGALKQFASADGAYGRHQKNQLGYLATPMGRFQIVGATLARTAKEMGLSDDTVFTPEVQNAMFNHLVDKRISGPRTMEGKMAGLRQEWEGFKNVSDAQLSVAITAYEGGDRSVLTGIAQGGGGGAAPSAAPAPRIALPVGSNGTNPAAQLIASATQEAPVVNDPIANNPNSALFRERLRENGIVVSDGESTGNQNSAAFAERLLRQGTPVSTVQLPNGVPTGGATPPSAPDPVFDPTAVAATTARTPAQALAQATRSNQSAEASARRDPRTGVQDLIDQSIMDRVFNRNGALISEFINASGKDETPAQAAARAVGEGGLIPGGNQQEVLNAINETIAMSGGSLSPTAAAALVANNSESRDLTAGFDLWPGVDSWWDGDRFSSANESRNSATRTNMRGVAEDLRQIGRNVDGSLELSRGTAQIANQRQSALVTQQLPQVQALLLSKSVEAANIAAAIERGQDTPANRAALAKALQTIQQLEAIINQVGVEPGSPTTIFSGAGEGLPAR